MAAIAMAKRICYERNMELGQEIGYTIRFEDFTTDKTNLRYVTDGILVRECLNVIFYSIFNIFYNYLYIFFILYFIILGPGSQ